MVNWRTTLDPAVFAQASREHRYVLLDLEAIWCHWCHVMDQQTYADPQVAALIARHYLAVRVDQDADPALAARYGEWGWPATIVFAPDGQELVKRRGFLPPPAMASLLQAIVDDPTPGPSVRPQEPLTPPPAGGLDDPLRARLAATVEQLYDAAHGGFGDGQKFLDADAMEWLFVRAQTGDAQAAARIRQTLDANRALLDGVWGGVFQYSENPDWTHPHFEKIMSYQAGDLRLYALAWAYEHRTADLEAAQAIEAYLRDFLRAPDGAFYTSQDADLDARTPGADYYALPDAARRARGLPKIDTHLYARDNGWAIGALCRLADTTGEDQPLRMAEAAARWVVAHRRLPDGGFAHGARDADGPYLADTLAMGEAFLDLYRATGERDWLTRAQAAGDFIAAHFTAPDLGFVSAVPHPAPGALASMVRDVQENGAATRFFARLAYPTGAQHFRMLAEHGLRFLVAYARAHPEAFLPTVLLADWEVGHAPVHFTVVGAKDDPAAAALQRAARAYPAVNLWVDWWDPRREPSPTPDIRYPHLARAAAFVCTERACSSPLFDPAQLASTAQRLARAGQR